MARAKRTIEEIIIDSFGDSRTEANFPQFTDEEYIGYVTAVVTLQNPTAGLLAVEILNKVRELFKTGKL